MSGIPFHSTEYGRIFFDRQLPRLIKALERIADALEKQNNDEKENKDEEGSGTKEG